jgi:hypothetical protein
MAQTQEKYFYGQGRVYSRPFGTTGRAGWRWWGDVSSLGFQPGSESVRHRESHSGNKASVRKFDFLTECLINVNLHQLDSEGLADCLNGTVTTVPGGSVTGESLGTVVVGDELRLDHPGVTALMITDSAGSPATIYNQASPGSSPHFELRADFGALSCLSLPTSPAPTAPLLAAYTYAARKQVAFLNRVPGAIALRYEGINLAEDGAPVIVEFYKVSTALLQELALITDGTDVAGTELSLEALLDSSKPSSGVLGQFGRLVEVG